MTLASNLESNAGSESDGIREDYACNSRDLTEKSQVVFLAFYVRISEKDGLEILSHSRPRRLYDQKKYRSQENTLQITGPLFHD